MKEVIDLARFYVLLTFVFSNFCLLPTLQLLKFCTISSALLKINKFILIFNLEQILLFLKGFK